MSIITCNVYEWNKCGHVALNLKNVINFPININRAFIIL
jgi:hypothetical protein